MVGVLITSRHGLPHVARPGLHQMEARTRASLGARSDGGLAQGGAEVGGQKRCLQREGLAVGEEHPFMALEVDEATAARAVGWRWDLYRGRATPGESQSSTFNCCRGAQRRPIACV